LNHGNQILLATGNSSLSESFEAFFKDGHYKLNLVPTGKEAQLFLYKNPTHACILDVEVKNFTAFEVIKYIKLNFPAMPLFLLLTSDKVMREHGLDQEKLLSMGATQVFPAGTEPKTVLDVISGQSGFNSWKNQELSTSQASGEQEVQASDEEFTAIRIDNFFSGSTTIFDTYVRLSSGHYTKILHKGELFDRERIQKYVTKGVQSLYFNNSERAAYVNFMNSFVAKIIEKEKVPLEKKVSIFQSLTEKFVEEIYTTGIKPQLLDEGKKICDGMYNLIQHHKDLSTLLKSFEEAEVSGLSHVFLTSLFAVVASKNLTWVTKTSLDKIVMGCFLHDIGKLKLPKELQDKKPDKMGPQEFGTYQQHPRLGMLLVANYPAVNEQVKQIVYQHHEYVNGEGFPSGLSGMQIFPLAKVASFANDFANFIQEQKVSPLEGLRMFLPNREMTVRYDPVVMKAFVQGFSNRPVSGVNK
jgi:response regulator RpfG family c-di-GMP phosphodiesterase